MDIKRLLGSKNLIFYSGIILIFLLVFLRLILGVNIPIYINLILFGLISIFSDRQQLVTLEIVCLPLSATFQYKYALLICVVVYFFKFNEDITIKRVVIPVLLMMFWEAIHLFWYEVELKEYFRSFSELIVVAFVMLIPLKKFNYTAFIRTFAFSCIGIIFIMLIYLLKENSFSISKIFSGGYRFGIINENSQNFGANLNPNNLGFICNLSIVGLAQLLLSKNGKILDVVLIALFITFGFMTMSRTFLLSLAIMIVICLVMILGKFSPKKRILIICGVIGIALIAILVLYLVLPSVITSFIKRFTVSDISNGRIDIFNFYNNHLTSDAKYLLFGVGIQNLTGKISNIYGSAVSVTHNGIQELLVVWGIPGLALFAWFIIEMFLQGKKLHKIKLINLLPFILLAIDIMFGQLIRSGKTMLALLIVYISLYVKFDVVGEYTIDDGKPIRKTIISRAFAYLKNPTKLLSLLNSWGFAKLFSDKFCIKFLFHNRVGVWPNLDEPKTFNEKLNWLKLNDRNPIYTTKVDKVKVKKYVADRIGSKYVIPSIAVWDNVDDMDFSILPDKFVLKCNHADGVIVCKDKTTFDIENAKKSLNKTLKREYFYSSREWPYKNVERKVFAEEFVKNNSCEENTELIVYKVFTFNGESKLIQVIQGDKTAHETIDYFDTKWNLLNLKQNYPNSEVHLEKPKVLDEMLKLSNVLSDGVPFVRVDWYIVDGALKFSEFTYYSDSGFERFYPNEWDEKLGSWIKLPIDK